MVNFLKTGGMQEYNNNILTLQDGFMYEKDIKSDFDRKGDPIENLDTFRYITDFVVYNKVKGQVPLEDLFVFAPCFLKGSSASVCACCFFFFFFFLFCREACQIQLE